jgi:proline iminopeptidase
LITGGQDYQTAVQPQRELVASLPRGQLVEYRKSGHFMFVEDPKRFARDVTAFLRRVVGR